MDKGIIEQIAFCMRWIDRNLVPQAQKHRCVGGKKSGGGDKKKSPRHFCILPDLSMKLFHVKFFGLKRAYSWKNVQLRDYNFWKPNIFLAMSTIIFYLIIFLVSKFHNPPPPPPSLCPTYIYNLPNAFMEIMLRNQNVCGYILWTAGAWEFFSLLTKISKINN